MASRRQRSFNLVVAARVFARFAAHNGTAALGGIAFALAALAENSKGGSPLAGSRIAAYALRFSLQAGFLNEESSQEHSHEN